METEKIERSNPDSTGETSRSLAVET
ncbi:uncharacterized protein G2W53_004478 [Senna tora]|uniref:Uncharacterized protein n=1 Tax=Senna tora TaxID=362788 RepID=A0A834XCY4_9FABA|nr:uncharacterized protein G2W53_004478 [Senna tora]